MVPPQYGNYGGAPRGPKQNIQEAAQELAERKHRESRYLASKYDARGLGSTEAGGWLEDEYKVEPRAHVDRTEAAERLAAVKHPFPWAAEANQRWAAASTHANRASQEPMRGHGKRLYKASEDPTRPQALPPLMPRLHRPGRRSPTLNLFAGNPSYEPRAARHPGAQQSSVFSAGEGKAYDYIDRKKHPRLYENAYKKLNSTVFSQHGAAGGGGRGGPPAPGRQPAQRLLPGLAAHEPRAGRGRRPARGAGRPAPRAPRPRRLRLPPPLTPEGPAPPPR